MGAHQSSVLETGAHETRHAHSFVATVLIAAAVAALVVAVYDLTVRQPRTPRLAVVDIARLFASAEAGVKERALGRDAGAADPRAAQNFGPAVEKVLSDLAGECRCTIVAMAAVIGVTSAIPDYTTEAALRLGVTLRPAYGRNGG
jgi:hypothetical protein